MTAVAPAKCHRVLVIGVGSIGERHVRCFQHSGRALVSICEVNRALCNDIASRYSVDHAYFDAAEAIQDDHDAVVIAVPAPLHVPLALNSILRGLHVLIEKPLSVSMNGIDELQLAAEQSDRVVAVAYVYRANPIVAEMKKVIESNDFGKPLQLIAVAGQHFPTYRPAYQNTYYAHRDSGGGAVQDALTHLVNAGEWLVGPVDRIVADFAHRSLRGVEVEDVVHVIARQCDVLCSYALNQFQSPNELTITVVCERGTLRFENHRSRLMTMIDPGETWHKALAVDFQRDANYLNQANSFLDSIEHSEPPLCSLNEAIHTLRANLAIIDSSINSSWEYLI